MAMTDEQKQAARERMLAMHAAKKAAKEEIPSQPTQKPQEEQKDSDTVAIPKDDLAFILQRLHALENLEKAPQSQPQTITINQGKAVGVNQVYSIAPGDYPDPREEILNMPQLIRLAFKENYLLDWNISAARWQSQDGLWFVEPKFELVIWKKLYDSETGEIRNLKALIGKLVLFEDPADSMANWEEAGISGDPESQENRDKLRIFRIKQYMLEKMFPPKNGTIKKRAKQEVIGGMVVDMEEYQAEVQ